MAEFKLLQSIDEDFHYRLRASGNHEIILRGEQYKTKAACETGIASVRVNAPSDARYERLCSKDRQYYFNLKATNGEVIGVSETYITSAARDHAIELVKAQAPTAPTEDLT